MNFKLFTEKVTKGVQDFLGEEVNVQVNQVRKNNGVYLQGMTFFAKDSNMSPTIYLEEFFEAYRKGDSLSSIVEEIVRIYDKTRMHGDMNMDFFVDYEKVRNNIFCRLINYEKNEEILKDIPHRKYLDLAIVCYYGYMNEIIGKGTIMIQNSHLEKWNISPEELVEWGMENTEKVLGCRQMNMREMMKKMLLENFAACMEEPDENIRQMTEEMIEERCRTPMYIVTNEHKCLGAICIMFASVLRELSVVCGGDFVILPSSVHEVIVVPKREAEDVQRLKEIVKEINESHVEPEEVLSDSVYSFDSALQKIMCQ